MPRRAGAEPLLGAATLSSAYPPRPADAAGNPLTTSECGDRVLHLVSKERRRAVGIVEGMELLESDVVVVGGRCAGAAAGMLLARRGLSVTVIERGRLSSDVVSTHAIARGGVVQLARWGLLDDVLASGAPAVREVVFRRGDDEIVRTLKDHAGVDLLVAPRRHVLDAILARAATAAGAVIRTGVTATGVLRDDNGHVRGVRARTSEGTSLDVTADLTVGADGVRSKMAGWLGAATLESYPNDAATFYVYVGGVAWRGFEYHVGPGAFAGVFPTHGGEACVWICGPTSIAAEAASDFAGGLAGVSPSLAERVAHGRITSRVRGTARLPNHLRQAAGPGWALVGDAGYHRDPVTGHGITDAFRDAELLARNVDDLRAYQKKRDESIRDIFAITREMARFPDPDRFTDLQRQLANALDVEATELAELTEGALA